MSNGTEAWSCTISQLPSSFWKQKVPRTHPPLPIGAESWLYP
jgi:hypothetical protein